MKFIIGAFDRVDFPSIDQENVRVKVDTGAKTSSIQASFVEVVKVEGKELLKCVLLGKKGQPVFFDDWSMREIKSSNGHTQLRYVVKMKIKLFGQIIETDFTLANRKDMKYPVLLGRRLLRVGFLVDPRLKDISYTLKNNLSQ